MLYTPKYCRACNNGLQFFFFAFFFIYSATFEETVCISILFNLYCILNLGLTTRIDFSTLYTISNDNSFSSLLNYFLHISIYLERKSFVASNMFYIISSFFSLCIHWMFLLYIDEWRYNYSSFNLVQKSNHDSECCWQ